MLIQSTKRLDISYISKVGVQSKLSLFLGDNNTSVQVYNELKDSKFFNKYLNAKILTVELEKQDASAEENSNLSCHKQETNVESSTPIQDTPEWDKLTTENYTKSTLDEYALTFDIKLNQSYKFETMVAKFKDKYQNK